MQVAAATSLVAVRELAWHRVGAANRHGRHTERPRQVNHGVVDENHMLQRRDLRRKVIEITHGVGIEPVMDLVPRLRSKRSQFVPAVAVLEIDKLDARNREQTGQLFERGGPPSLLVTFSAWTYWRTLKQ